MTDAEALAGRDLDAAIAEQEFLAAQVLIDRLARQEQERFEAHLATLSPVERLVTLRLLRVIQPEVKAVFDAYKDTLLNGDGLAPGPQGVMEA